VRPVTAQLVAGGVAVQVAPSGADVTVYPVIGEPPSAGGSHETSTVSLPGVTEGADGGSGSPAANVVAVVGADGALVPAAFVAVTRNV
jgi:hypothetical protein